MYKPTEKFRSTIHNGFFFIIIALLLSGFSGCGKSEQKIKIDSEYNAVFMANGQVFFGKLEETGPSYVLMKDVFYVRRQLEKSTKQVRSILIKRGHEWHSFDIMYIKIIKS